MEVSVVTQEGLRKATEFARLAVIGCCGAASTRSQLSQSRDSKASLRITMEGVTTVTNTSY